jgi:hypothetical protein
MIKLKFSFQPCISLTFCEGRHNRWLTYGIIEVIEGKRIKNKVKINKRAHLGRVG